MTSLHCISQDPIPQYRRQWIGLLTVPNQEQKAFNWLTRIAFRTPTEPYWPHKIERVPGKIERNGCRGQKHRPRSIFTGMLFASIIVDDIPGYHPFEHFKATPGIRDWVRDGQGYPGRITEVEMDRVRGHEISENQPPEIIKPHEFKIGERVRIVSDLTDERPPGTITRINGDGSLNIDVKWLLGQTTKMVLGSWQVEAV